MSWTKGLATIVGLLAAASVGMAQTGQGDWQGSSATNPDYQSQPGAAAAEPQYQPRQPAAARPSADSQHQPAVQPQYQRAGQPPHQPGSAAGATDRPAYPDQPVVPNAPRLRRRPGPQAATVAPIPQAPFQLSPAHEEYLNRILMAWEQNGSKVNTFEADFSRFEYDPVFGGADPNKPVHVDFGRIKYKAPDQGVYEITHTLENGEWVDIDEKRKEHWVCDGESIYQYRYDTEPKQLVEQQLPPEMQGQHISNGPLPFLFGAKAVELRERYWLRVVTPAQVQDEQIWLEAYPRRREQTADFKRAEVILDIKDLQLRGLQLYSPNGKSRLVYKFDNIKVNATFAWLRGNLFRATTPIGWKKIVEPAPSAEVTQQPQGSAPR